jgi:hypothetical protein
VDVDVKRCRVRVTPAGAHTVILVKSESGAEGVESWTVNGHRLERGRGCESKEEVD